MKTSVENKIVVGFMMSVLALISIGGVSYLDTVNLVAEDNWVAHTQQVLATLEGGLAILTDVETKQRGYLLTGNARFLNDCQAAEGRVAGWTDMIEQVTRDNPEQQSRVEILKSLIAQRLVILNNRIALRQQQGLEAAAAAVATGEGKLVMDQVWDAIAQMKATEEGLLAKRQSEAEAGARTSLILILAGSVLASVVGLAAVMLIRSDLKKRAEAEKDLQGANEKLQEANKELEAFSYSVSHDLRAPLRHIAGFVDLLKKNNGAGLDERSRRYLGIINDSAGQMGTLIDDLLVFSRMSRMELRRSKVATVALLDEARNTFQNDLNGRRIDWKIGTLPEVEADASMLRQVWINLIGNAVKYTRQRDPAEIAVGCTGEGNGEWVFFVRDNGVGFDMKYVDKLYGVFQRLHRADEFEGTGIGLANVRRIVSRHGGRTWAEGKLNEGATFYFSLPQTNQPPKE
jgi:signal transduction histidine kinase